MITAEKYLSCKKYDPEKCGDTQDKNGILNVITEKVKILSAASNTLDLGHCSRDTVISCFTALCHQPFRGHCGGREFAKFSIIPYRYINRKHFAARST